MIFEWKHCDAFFHDRHGRARRSPQKEDKGSDNRGKHEQRDGHFRPAHAGAMFLHSLEFPRQRRITELIVIEIYHRDAHAMLHFARTKVVQERSPLLVSFEVFSDMLRQQNVTGIAAIHYPSGHIDSSAREIGPFVYIDYAAHWPTVNSHPKLQARMFLEPATDLHRALRRRFRTGVEDQRHPVARWNFNQASCGFGLLKLL